MWKLSGSYNYILEQRVEVYILKKSWVRFKQKNIMRIWGSTTGVNGKEDIVRLG